MNRARAFAVGGVVAFGLGLGALVVPGLFVLGVRRAVVAVIGLLALGQAVRVAWTRGHATVRRTETGDPELPTAVESPGEDVAAALDRFDGSTHASAVGNRRRKSLRRVAVDALVCYENCSAATARERIDRGTWTEDPHAAAFLSDDDDDDVPSVSLRTRLRTSFTGESSYRRGTRRTVEAIGDVVGIEPEPANGEDEGSGRRFAGLGRLFDASPVGNGAPGTGAQSSRSKRLTGQWRGVSAAALAGIGVGVLVERPAVILLGVVGIGYAAYARSTSAPEPTLSLERSVSPARPTLEETVEVTVTVTNDGDRALPDLRLVDGVPPDLSVVEGSPREGTTLRAGESVTVQYAVDARRGTHEFGPMHAVARNLSGTVERDCDVSATETTAITCVPRFREVGTDVPLRERPTRLTGTVETNVGGDGTEFFATRNYRPGDPMNRVDWNRRAKTGELATLQFREERAATVVVVVDASESAAVGPEPRGPDAVDRAVDAASQVFTTVSEAGNRVGVAALADEDCWLPPSAGEDHRARARELLATDPAFDGGERASLSRPGRWQSRLRSRLPGDAQVVLCSPLCSDAVARAARQIDAYGYPVTVVSPDPTTHGTPGDRLTAIARRFRISDLRKAGVPVVDWAWDDPLSIAVAGSTERWST